MELKPKFTINKGELKDTHQEKTSPIKVHSFYDLWQNKGEIQPFLIDGFLPSEGIAVMIGEEGIGKTQLAKQLALSISMGVGEFLGMNLNPRHNKCLFIATEDSRDDFINSYEKQYWALASTEPTKEKPIIDFIEGIMLDSYTHLITSIKHSIKKKKYDVIFIDATSDLFTLLGDKADINSNSDARRIMKPLLEICSQEKVLIVLLHHAAKTKIVYKKRQGDIFVEKGDSLGAGAITQIPRTILSLSKDDRNNSLFLHICKGNLVGEEYKLNAHEIILDSETLIMQHQGLVNMKDYLDDLAANDGASTGDARQKKKPPKAKLKSAQDYTIEEHFEKLSSYFDGVKTAKECHFIIKDAYQIGDRKAHQEKGNFWSYLKDKNIIIGVPGGALFKLNKLPF